MFCQNLADVEVLVSRDGSVRITGFVSCIIVIL